MEEDLAMKKLTVLVSRIEKQYLIAALGVVSSFIGYAIAHLVFFETILMGMGGPVGSPFYTEIRDLMWLTYFSCGAPALVAIVGIASLHLEKRRKNQIPAIFRRSLIVIMGITLGFILYIPLQACFLFAYAL